MMKSTNHNLQNPMHTHPELELLPMHDINMYSRILYLNDLEYDIIQTKDPYTLYVVKDHIDGYIHMYIGTIPAAEFSKYTNHYFIGINNDNYAIYRADRIHEHDLLFKIEEYQNVNTALDKLKLYNKINSHDELCVKLFNSIEMYNQNIISLHQYIMSVMCQFNYSNSMLQDICALAIRFNCNDTEKFTQEYIDNLSYLYHNYDNSLVMVYYDIFNIAKKYKYFKNTNGSSNEIAIKSAIKEIVQYFIK